MMKYHRIIDRIQSLIENEQEKCVSDYCLGLKTALEIVMKESMKEYEIEICFLNPTRFFTEEDIKIVMPGKVYDSKLNEIKRDNE